MKKYTRNFTLFLLPILILALLTEVRLSQLGENMLIADVHQVQQNSKDVKFMRGVISQDYNVYKLEGINLHNPEILVVGSSRVMKFREEFFNTDQYRFYNAGGMIQSAHDLIELDQILKNRTNSALRLLIVGIDPWWFKKDALPNSTWLKENRVADHALEPSAHARAFLKMLMSPKKYFSATSFDQNIGLYAKKEDAGFRQDGSKCISTRYKNEIRLDPVFRDRETPPVNERIKKAITNRFTISEIDTILYNKTMEVLIKLQNSYNLIVYLPPFSTESYGLLENSEKHTNWWSFSKMIGTSDELKHSIRIPIEHSGNYGLDDSYFIDGFHPGEVFVARQLLKHFSKRKVESEIQNFFNEERIERMIDNTKYSTFFENK
jgi:hypothetical protein